MYFRFSKLLQMSLQCCVDRHLHMLRNETQPICIFLSFVIVTSLAQIKNKTFRHNVVVTQVSTEYETKNILYN